MLLVIALLLTNIYHPQNYDGLLYLFLFFSLYRPLLLCDHFYSSPKTAIEKKRERLLISLSSVGSNTIFQVLCTLIDVVLSQQKKIIIYFSLVNVFWHAHKVLFCM